MTSIFDILYIPMGYILRFAYSLTNNYLFAILLFAFVMEILLLPIAIKQQKNQIKQASLAPKTNAIRKKYAGRDDKATQQKMQEELMAMYQQEKFNPAGGCLPLLIQLPIIMCLYNVIINPLRYLCNLPKEQVTNLVNALSETLGLTARNQQIEIINHLRAVGVQDYLEYAPNLENAVLPNFTVGPFDLSQVPSIQPFNWLVVIPILTFVVMVASQKITQHFSYQAPEAQDAQNAMSMKIMTWTMPLLTVFIEFQMSAAIGVYWIFRQVLYTVERIILAKVMPIPQFTEEDYREAERQVNLSKKQQKKEKKQVRSLHHIDDEEYLAAHPDKAEAEAEWEARNGGAEADSSKESGKKSSTIEKAPPKE